MANPLDGMPNPELIFQSWWPWIIAVVCGFIYGLRHWFRGPDYPDNKRYPGKVAIITGGNSGIGRECAEDLAFREFRVYIACRNKTAGDEAVTAIRQKTKNKKVFNLPCDLASFQSIRDFVAAFKKKETELHLLINNAGIVLAPQDKTKEDFDSTLGINYIGHFLLTHLLLDMLKSSEPSRIVNLAAAAYRLGEIDFDDLNFKEREYKPGKAYSQSKLAVVYFTQELAKKLEGSKVTVNCVNPGVVNTNAYRHLPFNQSKLLSYSIGPFIYFMMKNPADGAATVLYCALDDAVNDVNGKLFQDLKEKPYEAKALEEEVGSKLWEETLKLTKLKEEK